MNPSARTQTTPAPARSDFPRALEAYLHAYGQHLHRRGLLTVSDLESHHSGFASSLHRRAGLAEPDISAFLYAALRLPDCVDRAGLLLIGPGEEIFESAGYFGVQNWPRVQSRARRRRYHFDGTKTLAVFVTSITDLDDIIPSLCAFQIEWNKMHRLLNAAPLGPALASGQLTATAAGAELRRLLGLNHTDWEMVQQVWLHDWDAKFAALARAPLSLRVERLPLHDRLFEEAAGEWWDSVSKRFSLDSDPQHPLFLVSSNTHGLANLLSGYATAREREITEFLRSQNPDGLWNTWLNSSTDPDWNKTNLLCYALRYYLEFHPRAAAEKTAWEESSGLSRCLPSQYPHLEAQQIELCRLDPTRLDSRLACPPAVQQSRARILNLDYPLGLAASHLMTQALRRFPNLRGVFILGKSAATLGRLGDILIPSQVYDSHTATRYQFHNCMTIRRLTPYLNRIAVFDDQKSVTVRGTFLHGRETSASLIRDDFTGMEMEAGPYLRALHRHFGRQEPAPQATLTLAVPKDFHLGLLHYTSDTPYNIRPSLLSTRLGLAGLEAAYASVLAIFQTILNIESKPSESRPGRPRPPRILPDI